MDCIRCTTPNDDIRKFCRSCGAPLGRHCDRCGTVNPYDDKFCGTCGLALIPSLKSEMTPEAVPGAPRQYTAAEVDELLLLRMRLKPGQKTAETISQTDIDELFG